MQTSRKAGASAVKGPKRSRHAGDTATCAVHWLPAFILPCSVGAFQVNSGVAGLPLVFVAAALGIVISAAIRQPRLAFSVTIIVTFLLVGASKVQDLQEQQIREIKEQDALHARRFLKRLPAPGHGLDNPDDARPDEVVIVTTTTTREAPTTVASFAAPPGSAARSQLHWSVGSATLSDEGVKLETISVVLPCAFEGAYAERTADAIYAHTNLSRLHEIIIVDDGSQPPLRATLPARLLSDSIGRPPLRIIRHDVGVGLIGAKKAGGNAAHGDVIAFLDCHIKPRDGWEEAFLKQMKRSGDHRTVVVPTITALDPDSWQEIAGFPSSKACYMLWNADFTWLADPGRDVPLMSGGLLALSRRWWEETGGLDEHMIAWGGENIDQSLRAWLCGGRIEVAEGAYVAHMWRDAKNPKTQLHYKMPSEDVMRNKARAASAWLGEFKAKTLSFPEYEWFTSGEKSIGDMSNFDELKSRLTCAPFSSYIQRFSYVYLDGGLIPEEVFQLREEFTGRCLERRPRAEPPHSVVLAPCAGGSESGGTPELQLWHLANRDRMRDKAPCCSGIMNWNFLQCLDSGGLGAQIHTTECQIAGHAQTQSFKLVTDHAGATTLQWRVDLEGSGCVGPAERKVADAKRQQPGACTAMVEAIGDTTVSGKNGEKVPEYFHLVSAANPAKGATDKACATAGTNGEDETFTLKFVSCDEGSKAQVFHAKPLLNGVQVIAGETGMCLDAAGGGQLLVYTCYEPAAANSNQVWHVRDGQLLWRNQDGADGYCVDMAEIAPPHQEDVGRFVFASCVPKRGQRLKRADYRARDDTYLLQDVDSGQCLGTPPESRGFERPLRMVACGEETRWRSRNHREQVQHVSTGFCLDAADEEKPIMYPCHEPVTMRKQKFTVVDKDSGGVLLKPGWEDNGRKRFFDRCLDYMPEAPLEVTVQKCDVLQRRGVKWSKIGKVIPPEFTMWQKAEKPLPGTPPLGGDPLPP